MQVNRGCLVNQGLMEKVGWPERWWRAANRHGGRHFGAGGGRGDTGEVNKSIDEMQATMLI